MDTRKVTCPTCKNLLAIPYSDGIEEKMLRCPICGFRAKVAVYMMGIAAQGGQGANDESTEVNIGQEEDRTIGSLYFDEEEFPLKKGRQTVGRKASSSTADIQINEGDRYMSRVHCQITVKEGGSGLEHQIEALNPKNPIYVNGKQADAGEILVLQWGDKIKMGHTELMFERPLYYAERTIIE